HDLPADVEAALQSRFEQERSPVGKEILGHIIQNAQLARSRMIPICQDTGFTSVLVELGQDVHVSGGDLYAAIHSGVRTGYAEGLLRMSVLDHPLTRKNTDDNTPAAIHLDIVPGDQVKLMVMPKGGGCENMSKLSILKPSQGKEGVKEFVTQSIKDAGPNACPPLVIGVGIGGTFDKCAFLAKKALFREIGSRSSVPANAELEEELLKLANETGLGPAGMGGDTTALAIHIESFPCHITSLPVAVNVQCHAARHKEAVL
ncbi:MAG: fumarate hydratase subunit alpha, partial [Armatimonadetes bacterium]|nr:fumarate hydratase subunit alpha [Armatimonadota bacterium]